MFTYVKFDDGVKAIVNTDDIVDFNEQNIEFNKKYHIKYSDGHFYYGIIGKVQNKPILEENEEAIQRKVKSKRVEFMPISLCISAAEIETESDDAPSDKRIAKSESMNSETLNRDLKSRAAAKISKLNTKSVESIDSLSTSSRSNFASISKKTAVAENTKEKSDLQVDTTKRLKSEINKNSSNLQNHEQSKSGKIKNCTRNIFVSNGKDTLSSSASVGNSSKLLLTATPTSNTTKSLQNKNRAKKSINPVLTDRKLNTNINKMPSNKIQSTSEHATIMDVTDHHLSNKPAVVYENNAIEENNSNISDFTDFNCALKEKSNKKGKHTEITIASLEKTNKELKTQISKLKNELKDKDQIIEDLMNLNMGLQSKIINEYPKLHEMNMNIQRLVLSHFDELMSLMIEFFKTNPINKERIGELPIGYRNIERNEVHLGYGVYVPVIQYDTVCVVSKSIAQFTKNLAVAVFGIKTLTDSTVTGAKSNRNKNKVNGPPRPALNCTMLRAIKAAVKHHAMCLNGGDEVQADYEAQQVGTRIAHKIFELNNIPKRKKDAQINIDLGAEENNVNNTNVETISPVSEIDELNNNESDENLTISEKEKENNTSENYSISDVEDDIFN